MCIFREELEETFNQIYGDGATSQTKEEALNRLKVWKIKNVKGSYPSILCTSAILEAQVHDGNSNGENVNELRSMYAGAFTKFINFLAETPGTGALKKGSMKQKVENIGIESFIVDLRHLCAHTSVTISIDVFRRSADYSINWLKTHFWLPEIENCQDVDIKRIRLTDSSEKLDQNLKYVLKIYDILTKALHRGSREIAESENNLSPSEVNLIKEHFKVNPAENLQNAVRQLVRFIVDSAINDPNLLANSILENCPYMIECSDKANFIECHQYLIQYITGKGGIQNFFEKLVEICEDYRERKERRAGCSFWAAQISKAFKNLKKFKLFYKDNSSCYSLFTAKEYIKPLSLNCKKNYFNALRVDARESIIIGATVDCPWHLSFSKAYVTERLINVSEYTKEIVDIILTLVEPKFKADKRRELSQLMDIYTGQKKSDVIVKGIYTLADLMGDQKKIDMVDWKHIPLGAVMDKIE